MSHLRRLLPPAAVAAALLLAASVAPAERPRVPTPLDCAAAAATAQDPRPACCFENPRYVGTCEVDPAKDETCASILEYLNNPQSTGKAYCNSTAIRGGWKIVPCEPKAKTEQGGSASNRRGGASVDAASAVRGPSRGGNGNRSAN